MEKIEEKVDDVITEDKTENKVLDDEKIVNNLFTKLKDLFSLKNEGVEDKKEPTVNTIDKKDVNNEDKVKEFTTMNEQMAKEMEELKNQVATLTQQTKEVEVLKALQQVDAKYHDFAKFNLENGVDINKFLEDNPQAKANVAHTDTLGTSNNSKNSISSEDADIVNGFLAPELQI